MQDSSSDYCDCNLLLDSHEILFDYRAEQHVYNIYNYIENK